MSLNIYSREDMEEIDRRVSLHASIEDVLAEVGKSLGQWFSRNINESQSIIILCGPGNNGNDGKALAKNLKRKGYKVKIWEILTEPFSEWESYDVIVDAVFGISINKNLPEGILELFSQINESDKMLVAIDLPSGVDPNNGKLWGGAFAADVTLVIGGLKRGLLLKPGILQAGRVEIVEVSVLAAEMDHWETLGNTISYSPDWLDIITPSIDDHKYSRGKVTHVMGKEFPGASLLAAFASQAIGAGYVDVFCPLELLVSCQVQYPSIVFKPYANNDDLVKQISQLEKTTCLCMGPGWRQPPPELVEILNMFKNAIVLDGGLLQKSLIQKIKNSERIVITPHEGELDELMGENSKWDQVVELGQTFNGVILAKGFDTIIYQSGNDYFISQSNSPFLSVAGTGDVLAGMIAGLIAQGLPPNEATQFAVYTHSYIGQKSGWGLTPETLVGKIGKAFNKFSYR